MTSDSPRQECNKNTNDTNDSNDTDDLNDNSSTNDVSSPPDNDNAVLRKGRFYSYKIKEENSAHSPTRMASVIHNICKQWNDADIVGEAANSTQADHRLQKLDVPSVIVTSPSGRDLPNHSSRLARKFLNTVRDPKKLGFKHICLLLLVLSYTILGATIFYVIESNYEHKMVVIRKAALEETILDIAKQMTTVINDPERTVSVDTMVAFLKTSYKILLKQEAAYVGSTFYKDEDPNNHMTWTFGSSFFFSMNVFTTTGYGSIAPESVLGKSCVVVYGFLFVPLTLVVIRDLGNWTLLVLTNIYAKLIIQWRKDRSKHDVEEGEVFTLPVFLCMAIMFVYLMGTTTFIYIYDKLSGPPGTGIDYFLSFYFSFISISTIGLGDVMPANVTFSPVITILFFFGMPLMKVVNSSTYQCVEKSIIGALTFLENRLVHLWHRPRIADFEHEPTKPRSITLMDTDASGLKEDPQSDITIHSLLTFIKSDVHLYGHHFGRVNLTAKTDTL